MPRFPTLHLDDVSAIPFLVDIAGVEEYQHRARLRAGDGDLFVAVTPPATGYEEYCRQRLGLGSPELLVAHPVGTPLAVARACTHGQAFERLVACTRESGGLCIHPYMGIEDVWELAGKLRQVTGLPVEVVGPPAEVTWLANDKSAFAALVARTLGPEWLTETGRSRDPSTLAGMLLDLAQRHRRVGLKRTRCASGMGNAVFDADMLQPERVLTLVLRFLERTEWRGDEEVLVVAWEQAVSSPSTQLWIPEPDDGPPRLDGIYEQILVGEAQVFVGSRPAGLPRPVLDQLTYGAETVARALQEAGYRGRCSFDHLLVGDPEGSFEVRFTECNGRWGGTSTPMSLLDRMLQGPRPPYRAQDFEHEKLVGVGLPEILDRLGDEVYDAQTGRGRYIFYNVGPLAGAGKLDVIALGASQAEAEHAMLVELPRLLGL